MDAEERKGEEVIVGVSLIDSYRLTHGLNHNGYTLDVYTAVKLVNKLT